MRRLNNRTEKIRNVLVPIIAVLLGFILAGVIMIVFGYDPISAYQTMFQSVFVDMQTGGINNRNIGEIFVTAAPLIFTALGFAVANAAGFFNIGLSGQALCGWVTSIWMTLSMGDAPRLIVLPLAILAGILAGAIAAAIPGILRAFFGTSEVIVTIMMNYILLFTSTHIVNNVMSQHIIGTKGTTKMIGANGTLQTPWLAALTNGSRLNLGIFFALLFLVLVWFMMKKTKLGFEIRAVGLNPFASEYAGMSSKRTIIISMVISGALAGFGGVVLGLGTFNNFFVQGSSLSIGFDGMAVSLLGGGSSIGIFLAAILFSILKLGGQGMQFAGVPSELVDVNIAIIIFFVGISFVIHFVLTKVFPVKKEGTLLQKNEPSVKDQSPKGGQSK